MGVGMYKYFAISFFIIFSLGAVPNRSDEMVWKSVSVADVQNAEDFLITTSSNSSMLNETLKIRNKRGNMEERTEEWAVKYLWLGDQMQNPSGRFRNNVPTFGLSKQEPTCPIPISKFVNVFTTGCVENQFGTYPDFEIVLKVKCENEAVIIFRDSALPSGFRVSDEEKTYEQRIMFKNASSVATFDSNQFTGFLAFVNYFTKKTLQTQLHTKASTSSFVAHIREIFTITYDDLAGSVPTEAVAQAYDGLPDTFKGNEVEFLRFFKKFGTHVREKVIFGGYAVAARSWNDTFGQSGSAEGNSDTGKIDQMESNTVKIGGIDSKNFQTWDETLYDNPVPIQTKYLPISVLIDKNLTNLNKITAFADAIDYKNEIIKLQTEIDLYKEQNEINLLAAFVTDSLNTQLEYVVPNYEMFQLLDKINSNRQFNEFWIKCFVRDGKKETVKIMYLMEGICINFFQTKCRKTVANLPIGSEFVDVFEERDCNVRPDSISYKLDYSHHANLITTAFEELKSIKISN